RGKALECGASSFYVGSRRGLGKADDGSGQLPGKILRPGAERCGIGLRVDSYSPAGYSGENLFGSGLHGRRSTAAGWLSARRSAARRTRAWHRAAGDDPGRRKLDPGCDSIPQNGWRRGSDVRRAVGGSGTAAPGSGDILPEVRLQNSPSRMKGGETTDVPLR